MGPCQARLESLGNLLQIVVGAFGEASTDMNRMIQGIAESRVLYLSRQELRPVTDSWNGQVLSQHSRYFLHSLSGAKLPVWFPGWGIWGRGTTRQQPGGMSGLPGSSKARERERPSTLPTSGVGGRPWPVPATRLQLQGSHSLAR